MSVEQMSNGAGQGAALWSLAELRNAQQQQQQHVASCAEEPQQTGAHWLTHRLAGLAYSPAAVHRGG